MDDRWPEEEEAGVVDVFPQKNQPVAGAQPCDKRGEFLKGRPPVFTHATDPLEADDWLRAVEKQLNIAQCDDWQKVLFAFGQL
jgi:hypothetical protein